MVRCSISGASVLAGKRKLSQNQSKKIDELKSSVKFLGSFGDINISDLLDPEELIKNSHYKGSPD